MAKTTARYRFVIALYVWVRSKAKSTQSPPCDAFNGLDDEPYGRGGSIDEAGVDEGRIGALACRIARAERIPLWMATERAAIMLYGSDIRGIPEATESP
jgi:hypothetical protein